MILNTSVLPSEGEVSVKAYLCTSFNSWFLGIKADGYLEVTNRRLLFQAAGTSATKNNSTIHSEVPISDISGINVFVGKAFNALRLVIAWFVIPIIATVSAGLFTGLASYLDSPIFYQFIVWIVFFGTFYLAYIRGDNTIGSKDKSLQELFIACVGLGALLSLAKGLIGGFGGSYGSAVIAIPVGIAALIYVVYRYAKRPAFSLFIHSKSGTSTIVGIAGPAPGLANSVASRALTASPGRDSQLVLKELGAVIQDVQTQGDLAVEKWRGGVV